MLLKLIVTFIIPALFWNPALSQHIDNQFITIKIGILPQGKLNAITDVAGVKVGHFTLEKEWFWKTVRFHSGTGIG